MSMVSRFIFLLLVFCANSSFAYVDLSLNYSQSSRKLAEVVTEDGEDAGSARTNSTNYSVVMAWYLWEYTAIELNYSQSTEKLTDDRVVASGTDGITIMSLESTVVTKTSGAGIRQAFASRKSAIIPSLAIGYAQYTTSGTSKYLLDVSGTEVDYEQAQDAEVTASGYVTFTLRLRLTQLMGLTFAANSVMPDFDTDLAEDNVTYSAGLSWIF